MSAALVMTTRPRAAQPTRAHSQAVAEAARVILAKSKSFSWAARLLPRQFRDDAVVLYAWCRRADDAVDDAPDEVAAREALDRLDAELRAIYAGEAQQDLTLKAFADVVTRTHMPRYYPAELLAGMRMDLDGTHYANLAILRQYCFRVAGTVGLMMCHVFGVTHPAALRRAVHLGMAMQLTNICRDVGEDWQRGRLYLPDPLLEAHGIAALAEAPGGPLPTAHAPQLASIVQELLLEANVLYHSGRAGLRFLPWQAALAVGVAQAVYADIGTALAEQNYDPLRRRAFTSRARKAWLTVREMGRQVTDIPRRMTGRGLPRTPVHHEMVMGAEDVLQP